MAFDNSFSIHSSLQRFLKRCPKLEKFPQFGLLAHKGNLVTEEEVVNVLVGVFLHPSYTIPLMGCFRPIGRKFLDKAVSMLALVPNLRPNMMDNAMEVDCDTNLEDVANVIEFYIEQGRFLELHEHACLAFCRALDMDSSLLSSVLSYFKLAPAPFERFSGKQVMDGDHDLLVARISYRLLLLEPETFLKFWNWNCFLELNPRDSHLAWCRVQISKVLLKSGCRTTESLNTGDEEAFACLSGWEEFCGDTTQEKAGCFVEPIMDYVSDSLGGSLDGSTGFNHENCLNSIGRNDHSTGLAKLHELQPPLRSQRLTTRGDISVRNTFVLTSEVKKSYERVLLAVNQKSPVLLSGPSGSGKSALIAKVAQDTGNQVLSIQMDDQIDGRTLVGGYVCTDRPGEFKWQPGSLTQAVQNGFWTFLRILTKHHLMYTPFYCPYWKGLVHF